MQVIGALRVKNEGRWIKRVLESIRPLVDATMVFDDHSTDNTIAEAMRVPNVCAIHSPFDGLNEVRDKNFILAQLADSSWLTPNTWVIMIDGDEILEDGSIERIKAAMKCSPAPALSFEVVYLWDNEQTVRTDLRTFCRQRASMFRWRPGATFRSAYPIHGMHCGNVPHGFDSCAIHARLLHLGYMLREDRIRKWAWYNSVDPGNVHEDCYNHMIIGDTPELPASTVTKWGGPLKLEALR